MVFYNLFAPTRCIEFQQTGSDAKTVITRFMKEDPEALKEVMAVLTEDIATLAKAVIADGHADGIYLSVQNIPHPDMTYEKYRELLLLKSPCWKQQTRCLTITCSTSAATWAATTT